MLICSACFECAVWLRGRFCVATAGSHRVAGSVGLDSEGEVDTSELCLWAVGISLTHPATGELMSFNIDEPPLFEAVRAAEFETWRSS